VAMRRAAHQLLDHPAVFQDPLAVPILGKEMAAALQADPTRFERGRLSSFLRAFFAARSRMAEDQLGLALTAGVGQYVILGAGLDTFAYRRPHRAGLRVFEVDHPATQAWKRQRLVEAEIDIPDTLTFVPVDFEHDDLGTALARAGVDTEPVFFAWLGVTPYLHRTAVMATLRTIARLAAGGGGVVFDYGIDPGLLSGIQRMAFDAMAARVSAAGEPWVTFFDPDRLIQDLHAAGFSDVADAGAEEINRRYFSDRADGLRVGGLGHIMTAWARGGG
jgi:methyltransferase (TIGR00027 family)